MAENTDSTRAPTPQDDFDEAFSAARIITDIIAHLADGDISSSGQPCASLYAWLARELDTRLERIEVADTTMRRVRA